MESKTVLVCAIAEASFARFKASMAVFNAEIASSHSSGRLDPTSMVETRGSRERTVQRGGQEEGFEPNRAGRQFCHIHSVEKNCICDCTSAEGCCVRSADHLGSLLTPRNWNPASGSEAERDANFEGMFSSTDRWRKAVCSKSTPWVFLVTSSARTACSQNNCIPYSSPLPRPLSILHGRLDSDPWSIRPAAVR